MSRNARKIELPKDFAQKLLDCQIQFKLAHKPSKQIVKNLIELYSLGVEYYQSIRSHKYLYFQLKMSQIFSSSNALSSINDEKDQEKDSPLKKRMDSNLQQDKILAIQIKQKKQKMLKQIQQNSNQKNTVSTVKQIISENQKHNVTLHQKVNKQIKNQDSKLKQKLEKRKSRMLMSKSFSQAGFAQNQTKDTLFTEVLSKDHCKCIEIKPIQVSFGNIIKQNESDNQQMQQNQKVQKVERSKSSVGQTLIKKPQI